MATVADFDNYWIDIKTATAMLYQNMESERAGDMMPSYFGHALTREFVIAEVAYGAGRSVFFGKTVNLIDFGQLPR